MMTGLENLGAWASSIKNKLNLSSDPATLFPSELSISRWTISGGCELFIKMASFGPLAGNEIQVVIASLA